MTRFDKALDLWEKIPGREGVRARRAFGTLCDKCNSLGKFKQVFNLIETHNEGSIFIIYFLRFCTKKQLDWVEVSKKIKKK